WPVRASASRRRWRRAGSSTFRRASRRRAPRPPSKRDPRTWRRSPSFRPAESPAAVREAEARHDAVSTRLAGRQAGVRRADERAAVARGRAGADAGPGAVAGGRHHLGHGAGARARPARGSAHVQAAGALTIAGAVVPTGGGGVIGAVAARIAAGRN